MNTDKIMSLGVNVVNLFSSLMPWQNKLECFVRGTFFRLVVYFK